METCFRSPSDAQLLFLGMGSIHPQYQATSQQLSDALKTSNHKLKTVMLPSHTSLPTIFTMPANSDGELNTTCAVVSHWVAPYNLLTHFQQLLLVLSLDREAKPFGLDRVP